MKKKYICDVNKTSSVFSHTLRIWRLRFCEKSHRLFFCLWSGCHWLETDDCGVVVDDGFVLGADIVTILKNAAKHLSRNAVDAQPQCCLGHGPQDAAYGLVDDLLGAADELLHQLVVAGLVALCKCDIGSGHRLLQIIEQQVGDAVGRVGQVHVPHDERVLDAVVVDGLSDVGPVAREDAAGDGGDAVGEQLARVVAELGVGWEAVQGDGAQLQFAGSGMAVDHTPLAGITHRGGCGDLDHGALTQSRLADVGDMEVPGEDDVDIGFDQALAQLAGAIDHIG